VRSTALLGDRIPSLVIWVPGFLIHTAINAGLSDLVAAGMVSRLQQ